MMHALSNPHPPCAIHVEIADTGQLTNYYVINPIPTEILRI